MPGEHDLVLLLDLLDLVQDVQVAGDVVQNQLDLLEPVDPGGRGWCLGFGLVMRSCSGGCRAAGRVRW